jgi:hypothetical protein
MALLLMNRYMLSYHYAVATDVVHKQSSTCSFTVLKTTLKKSWLIIRLVFHMNYPIFKNIHKPGSAWKYKISHIMGKMDENHKIKYITSKYNVPQIHDSQPREKQCSLWQHSSGNCTGFPPLHTHSLSVLKGHFITDYCKESDTNLPVFHTTY